MNRKSNVIPIKNGKKSLTLTVFILTGKESSCSECGSELFKGGFLFKEDDRGICLQCADMDHLLFLPSGDAALTLRSKKLSKLSAVVIKWSRTRKRYERQGILCEEKALHEAEELCLKDKDLREARRERNRMRLQKHDEEYKVDFMEAIIRTFPNCPPEEAEAIAGHACLKYSGRIGRSAAAKRFVREAINLAVTAHIRHSHTNYDILLMQEMGRRDAREEVQAKVKNILHEWSR